MKDLPSRLQVSPSPNSSFIIGGNELARIPGIRTLSDRLYESQEADPYLLIEKKFEAGTYIARIGISAKSNSSVSKIYHKSCDGNDEYSEDRHLIVRPAIVDETRDRWTAIVLEADSYLRFDPVECLGIFAFEYLSIARCSEEFARCLMRKYIRESTKQLEAPAESSTGALFVDYSTLVNNFSGNSRKIAYQQWLSAEKKILALEKDYSRTISDFTLTPLISIVLPTFNSDLDLLHQCIDSVRNQAYCNWELCISDDNSAHQSVKDLIRKNAEQDKRIKAIFRSENGHISANSNSALELATGEYVAFLDHDDALPRHSLVYLVAAINKHPDAGILYSDEDKIDITGARIDPHFKPAFNFDMLFGQNYICHLLCIRSSIVRKLKGFALGTEGCQDHDLLLRASYQCATEKRPIIHIPVVLYHWRMAAGSTALNASNKSYTTNNYLRAIEAFFKSSNRFNAKALAGRASNTYYIDHEIKGREPKASIIIPTRDRVEITKVAYESVLAADALYSDYEILIVDNQSSDPETLQWFDEVSKNPKTRIIKYDKEFNYSAINNFAVDRAKGDIVVLLNNDVKIISGEWLKLLVSHAVRPDVGCVGGLLFFEDDSIQHAGVILGIGGVAGHSHKYYDSSSYGYHSRLCLTQEVSAVTAACLAIRKSTYKAVGGFDEKNLRVAFNDIDFCIRVRNKGYRNILEPRAKLYHYESKSRGKEDNDEKKKRFESEVLFMKETWGQLLESDPFYNPNLTIHHEDFSIRLPTFDIINLPTRAILP